MTGATAEPGQMECGICWQVYDPNRGDPVWQIAPGTAFTSLPDSWRCPHCDAPREKFLPLDPADRTAARGPEGAAPSAAAAALSAPPDQPVLDATMTARIAALVAAYREGADPRMRALPIYNPALEIEAVGFQPWPGGSIGIMITPWFMNTVLLPRGGADRHPGEGSTHRVILPSGSYEFVAAWIEGVGMIRNCSLFSPMTDFVDQRAARLTAEAALTALLTAEGNAVPTQAAPPRETPAAISRRQLLRGANGSF